MAVLDILLLVATFRSALLNKELHFFTLDDDYFFKKLPKFVQLNFGTAKVPIRVKWSLVGSIDQLLLFVD